MFEILIKTVDTAVFVCWFYSVCMMIVMGKRTDYTVSIHPTDHEEFAPVVKWMTVAMIVAASVSHVLIRREIGGAGGPIFWIHLPAAVVFAITLFFMHRFPGTTHHERHSRIAHWILMPSFAITSVTGPILIWRM